MSHEKKAGGEDFAVDVVIIHDQYAHPAQISNQNTFRIHFSCLFVKARCKPELRLDFEILECDNVSYT